MLSAMLVVVTHLAKAAWEPRSSLGPLPFLLECTRFRVAVAADIH